MMLFLWNRMQFLMWMGILLVSASVVWAEEDMRVYNVPAGLAEETLKMAAEAGHLELVYSPETIEAVYTQAISGEYTARQALEAMLADTPLEVVPVREGKAFGIVKRARRLEQPSPLLKDPSLQKQELNNFEETDMNPSSNNFFKALTAFFALSTLTQPAPISGQENQEDDVFELTPFTISEDDGVGYMANNTLAGSRLNTPLADTAASIDVITLELIEDIGATSIEEALEFSTNSANDFGVNMTSDNEQFSESANRVNIRGLQGSRTRNYLPIVFSADVYNIGRVEENRGPNSILFGIGSASGIINVSTKRARLNTSFSSGTVTVNSGESSAGGYRVTLDVNQAIGNAFALRINTVYSDLDDPLAYHAYRKFKGLHIAASAKLSEKVLLTGEVEWGREDAVQAVRRVQTDAVTNWLFAADPRYTFPSWQNPGVNLGEYGLSSLGNGQRATYIDNNETAVNFRSLHQTTGPGLPFYEENYPELWDKQVNTGGPGQLRDVDFFAAGGGLEIEIGPQTFLEINVGHNEMNRSNYGFIMESLKASPNEYYRDNTTPNPYVGEMYFEGQYRQFNLDRDFTSFRATLSHEQDFGKFGNYRMALMAERDDESTDDLQRREVWVDSEGQGLFHSDPRNGNNVVRRRHYIVSEGDWESYYASSPVFGLIDGIAIDSGQTGYSAWRNQNSGQSFENTFTTAMVGLQARYFDNRLIVGLGYRKDKQDQRLFDIRDENNQFILNEFGERITTFDSWRDNEYKGNTKTSGVVFHLNDNLRFLANWSDNFGLPSSSRFEYPNNGAPRNTVGEGQDFGLGFSFFNNRISGRLTRFETDSKNLAIFNFNLTTINSALLDALVLNQNVTGITQSEADRRFIAGTGGIYDQRVEGYEFSITANVTDNWRFTARYSYTDGYSTNSFPDQREWRDGDVNGRLGGFGGLTFFENPAWTNLPMSEGSENTIGEYIADFKDDLAVALSSDGVSLPKNQPYKANFFTRYSFKEGALQGLYLGGGYRYTSAADLGFGNDSNGKVIRLLGTSQKNADFLVGYNFGEFLGLDDFSLQLNVSNVFNYDDYIITRRLSNGDTRALVYQRPRLFRLTANFDF